MVTAWGPEACRSCSGTADHREKKGLLGDQKVRAVQLGAEVDGQIQSLQGREGLLGVGHGDGEIAAKTDQRLGPAVDHRLQGGDRVMAVTLGRLEAEGPLDPFKQGGAGLLGDADRTVALHVRMAPQRADAGPRLADIALQQQKVGDLLDVRRAFVVLGHAHAVGDDRRAGPRIGPGDKLEIDAP